MTHLMLYVARARVAAAVVVDGSSDAVSGDWFPSEEAACDAARRVQPQAGTAIGP